MFHLNFKRSFVDIMSVLQTVSGISEKVAYLGACAVDSDYDQMSAVRILICIREERLSVWCIRNAGSQTVWRLQRSLRC